MPTTSAEGQRGALRRCLRHPAFRRLFIAQTISRWGDTFNTVAFVIVVFQLTGSGVKVGGAVIMEIAPVLLLGFVAGVAVDRLPRRQVMITADLGRAAITGLLILSPDHLWTLYPAAFGLSALTVFFNPAAASIVPALVDDELVAANSAIWSAAVISQIALAPLAGALVTWVGPRTAFAINAASFLASATILTRLTRLTRLARLARLALPPRPHESRKTQLIEGLRIIRRSRFHHTLATVQGLAALSAGATSALLVVLGQQHLDVGPGGFGLLLAAIGIGAGLGPLALTRLVTDVRRPALLFGPYLLRGIVDLALAATSNLAIALAALGAYGIGTSTGNVTYTTALQTTTPDHLRGRVFAFYDIIWQTARLASIALGGLLADHVGIRSVYIIGGILLLAAGTLGYIRAPRHAMTHPSPANPPDLWTPPPSVAPQWYRRADMRSRTGQTVHHPTTCSRTRRPASTTAASRVA